jgi:hypothetical protein
MCLSLQGVYLYVPCRLRLYPQGAYWYSHITEGLIRVQMRRRKGAYRYLDSTARESLVTTLLIEYAL